MLLATLELLDSGSCTRGRTARERLYILLLLALNGYPFKEKVLSLGKVAELSGLSKWDFIEYLSDNDVPVVDYDQDEITRELEAAGKLTERLKTTL
ncbi:MAG: UPF0175 family protein [Thermodesulfobacteriota bacterium]|nr:UPF0175 family protein [Thermodesulfobacteriota bacterium]